MVQAKDLRTQGHTYRRIAELLWNRINNNCKEMGPPNPLGIHWEYLSEEKAIETHEFRGQCVEELDD